MSIYYLRSKKTDVLLVEIKAEATATGIILTDTISYFNSSKEEIAREVYKDGSLAGITIFDNPVRHAKIQNFARLKKRERLIKKRVRLVRK